MINTGINRRRFLSGVTASGALLPAIDASARPASPTPSRGPITDINVSLGHWPLRRVPLDETPQLVKRLRALGVTEAWAGSLDGLLHKDVAAVNRRLAEECRRHGPGLLRPFGTIHPRLPDWEEELRRCAEVHRMPGIRLHPNYHGYRLEDPAFLRLLLLAAELRMVVQIALVMEDERMMHPLLRVEPVDASPLVEAIQKAAGIRIVLLNALRTLKARPLLELLGAGDVSVDIAMLEGIGGLENILGQVSASKVLFGSHAPLFYPEAALLKLRESDISTAATKSVRSGNARRLLARD